MGFHPLIATWFEKRFGEATEPQRRSWPLIGKGHNVLISAPTGSGKTLAAFLSAIDGLVRRRLEGELTEETSVLYLSPLKALANDVRKNLLEPLGEIRGLAQREGCDFPEIRALVRTGDTTAAERRRALAVPPHILVTTPESLFILLTGPRGREMLKSIRTVIVDEIHALAQNKRGSHLALSLERLEHLTGSNLQRIGLSATLKPIDGMASFLVGAGREAEIVAIGHRRSLDLQVEVPSTELGAVATHEVWEEVHLRLAKLIQQHRTTLVFVNTRRMAERTAHRLGELIGTDRVGAHHGSLSKETRLEVERRLKRGALEAVVATASLELGIDIGFVDLVCQLGSPRSITLALQRIGRSGHWKGATPKGRLFATTRDELLECSALVRGIRLGRLDRIRFPDAPLDVLAQQIVAAVVDEDWSEDGLFALVARARPYSDLSRPSFDSVVRMLSEGIVTAQGRRSAYLHRDRVNGRIRARRGARLAALTSGGTIPENANYAVKARPDDVVVGDVDEDFAVESMRGDVFVLGNMAWRIQRIEAGVVWVEDAAGASPNIPFWRGEAPGRTDEVSTQLSTVRREIAAMAAEEAANWLKLRCGLTDAGARQAVSYVQEGAKALGVVPSDQDIVAERFFDEAGGMQLVLHAPLGSRINKAWGLALRKRFCRSFNFELQAAATDDGIVLSLSDQHSFPLDSVFSFLPSRGVRDILIQALLAVPLFGVRWRWTATRALAIRRFSGGRKVPPLLQRMRSDDLLASVFPEQAACLEHIVGDITVPDHPLLVETLKDCLTDALDLAGLQRKLERIENGEVRCVAIDTREPSVFSHEILNANPFAFLDNAPLEERRTRAVQARRFLPEKGDGLARLDPESIERVSRQSWPLMRNRDEVHDALLSLVAVPTEDLTGVSAWADQLIQEGRAFVMSPGGAAAADFLVAAERRGLAKEIYPKSRFSPAGFESNVCDIQWEKDRDVRGEDAVAELIQAWMQASGPWTATRLAQKLALGPSGVEKALLQLEAQGQVLRGSFRPSARELEWCDRRLLARIHRLTLRRLRREIEPVSPAQFMRFLFRWQHVAPGTQLHGVDGTSVVLDQLQGFETPAAAWEDLLLGTRVADYKPEFLDQLCLSGQFAWGRISAVIGRAWANQDERKLVRPTRLAPVAFFRRDNIHLFLEDGRSSDPLNESIQLTHPAKEILNHLHLQGASFFQDLVRSVQRLPVEVESGLWELVAAGLVSADGFANLRALIDPLLRRAGKKNQRRTQRRLQNLSTGRWTLVRQSQAQGETSAVVRDLEALAFQFLRRWGVFFRDLLGRESVPVAWRDLLPVLRRLEAQGRIRGGRFIAGVGGEQFALPEAVDALRTVRRNPLDGQSVHVSAADPLNLLGIILPGPRVRPNPETQLHFRDGCPMEDRRVAG